MFSGDIIKKLEEYNYPSIQIKLVENILYQKYQNIKEWAKSMGISRTTVYSSFNVLINEGIVIRDRGWYKIGDVEEILKNKKPKKIRKERIKKSDK